MTGRTVGIEAVHAFAGVARIAVAEMFRGRGLDQRRRGNLDMDCRSVQMPWEDPVTNAVNAARPMLDALDDRDRIEALIVSTESGLDYSKSLASMAHRHLGLSRGCRLLEVKQACYGATGAVQLAAGLLRSAVSGTRVLVIATDVNPMGAEAAYAEPTTGHGAVAVLLSDRPDVLALDEGAYGLCGFDVRDTSRPRPDLDLYNSDLSLLTYLECLSESYGDYRRRVPSSDFLKSFDHLVMHTPFAGMVRAAHRRLMRELAPGPPAAVAADFHRRVEPTLGYARQVGNLCSGSLYLALASLVRSHPPEELADGPVGLYSYGSGCSAEFFSGRIGAHARARTGDLEPWLAARTPLTFEQYERQLPQTREVLVPKRDREVDLSACERVLAPFAGYGPMLVLESVADYDRKYSWRTPG